MGYLIGIDFGTKRTGLALTDPNKMIASGLKSLPTHEVISYLKVLSKTCLLYTSDAADDLTRVDLGGRRIIKKKIS